jgi:hypothetical protein
MKASISISQFIYRILLVGIFSALALGVFLNGGAQIAHAQLPTERPARVATNTIVSVVPSKETVNQGEEFDILVNISTSPEDYTSGAQFQLLFDPRYIEVTGFTEGAFYKDWAAAHAIETIIVPEPYADNEAGMVPTIAVSLLGFLPEEIVERASGSGTLMILHAKAKEREGTSELKIEDVVVTDFPVPGFKITKAYEGVKIQNGVVTIGAGAAVQNTPTAELVPTATKPAVLVERPTVEVVTPQAAIAASSNTAENASGFNSAWLLAIPVIGALLVGVVVIFSTRKR